MIAGESAGANATLVTFAAGPRRLRPDACGRGHDQRRFDFSWSSPSISINAGCDTALGERGLAFLKRWYRPDVDATDPLISRCSVTSRACHRCCSRPGTPRCCVTIGAGDRAGASGRSAGMARGLPRGSARLASARDVASRDARRAAANRAVRQRHPSTEERLVSIDQLSPSGTEVVDVRNPATGQLVGSVAVQSAEAVAAVVDELRAISRPGRRWGPTPAPAGCESCGTGCWTTNPGSSI